MLATDVLKAAVAEAKSGKNVELYEKAVRALSEVAPTEPEASLDSSWVQEVQRSVRAQTERLEHELRGYKNNLIKESIRVCTGTNNWMIEADLSRWAMRIWEITFTKLVN